jgi:hypothetical protein
LAPCKNFRWLLNWLLTFKTGTWRFFWLLLFGSQSSPCQYNSFISFLIEYLTFSSPNEVFDCICTKTCSYQREGKQSIYCIDVHTHDKKYLHRSPTACRWQPCCLILKFKQFPVSIDWNTNILFCYKLCTSKSFLEKSRPTVLENTDTRWHDFLLLYFIGDLFYAILVDLYKNKYVNRKLKKGERVCYINIIIVLISQNTLIECRGRRGCDRMVVGFIPVQSVILAEKSSFHWKVLLKVKCKGTQLLLRFTLILVILVPW